VRKNAANTKEKYFILIIYCFDSGKVRQVYLLSVEEFGFL
jgi:hypothetical protein